MSFPGQEDKPAWEARPLRKFTYQTAGSTSRCVEANYLIFSAGHVNFWVDRESPAPDFLVLSVNNKSIFDLKETP